MPSAFFQERPPAGDVYFNFTPLVDILINLMLFFVLSTTLSSHAMARVHLPLPQYSQAVDRDKMPPARVVVNVVSQGEGDDAQSLLSATAKTYEVENQPIRVGDKDMLVRTFKRKRQEMKELMGEEYVKDFYVEVRADRRVQYADIEPVLTAAAEAQIAKMNITALVDVGR